MEYTSYECPHCEARTQWILGPDREKHLRECHGCNRWFVLAEGDADRRGDWRVDSLDEPPTCPIDGCEDTVAADELPPHIIDAHEGTLA